MNILIITSKDTGGAANSCLRLYHGLREHTNEEHQIKILFRDKSSLSGTYSFEEEMSGMSFFLRSRLNRYYEKATYLGKPKAYELFRIPTSFFSLANHPLIEWADVINLHRVNRFLDYNEFFKSVDKPIFWTLHDMEPFSPGYPYLSGLQPASYEKIFKQNLANKKAALKGKELTIVAPSKWLVNASKKSELFKAFKHFHVPYGIDTKVYTYLDQKEARSINQLPQDEIILLTVAADLKNKRKGFHHLLESLKFIKTQGKKVTLYTVGKKVNLDSNNDFKIVQLGTLPNEQLTSLYASANLFIIPSIEDNLPNTVIESLCCGTPVVGFNIGGVVDMITDGVNGFLCQQISARSLGKTVNDAIEVSWNNQEISKLARKKFALANQAKKYLELFEATLKLT